MDAVEYYQDYIAHFGTKGQTWGLRRHQSYGTAPTRSGMVGQEVGDAAKQRSRLEKQFFEESDSGKTGQSLETLQKIQKIDSDKTTNKYAGKSKSYHIDQKWDTDYKHKKIKYHADAYSEKQINSLEKHRESLLKEVENKEGYALKKQEKRYDKIAEKEVKAKTKMLERMKKMEQYMKDHPEWNDPDYKIPKEVHKMDIKNAKVEAKTNAAKAKVDLAYTKYVAAKNKVSNMKYSDLKKDQNKRRVIAAASAVAGVVGASAASALFTQQMNQMGINTHNMFVDQVNLQNHLNAVYTPLYMHMM